MAWTLDDAAAVTSDLDAIFDHLLNSYLGFGDPFEGAFNRANERVGNIYVNRERLLKAPHIGTRHVVKGHTYRHVTIDRAIYWFALDDTAKVLRVLGIFHGGQDHLDRMMSRLADEGDS
ncbi:type II toxin-antitoxin system RelE/ParE family toxin [Marivita sp. S6314]|uniref:type II toxin-antitoxin system RelE/ParE family toxin n=1 Tax=Marivita sp. S6314 TaxID=2926406 RepID=UPI001FF61C07|nr:type II toxin-antitoxin system RelE/ParE family toxin [Marivita sp. S6314]MCK0149466.1 type II toxin-antitoxin system RelE/ParE family toxin [Marivita sp. S6314]